MCGRYEIDNELTYEIKELALELGIEYSSFAMKNGEIYPTDRVPVLISEKNEIKLELLKWGFPNSKDGKTIINARQETVEEKMMFRESFLFRRCVIPASGFFEWNKNKEKIYFTVQEDTAMYMAGIFSVIENELRFVIMTTSSNSSIADVHDRMPLLLSKDQIKSWILVEEEAKKILQQTPSLLNRSSDYEQQTLDFF